VQNARNNRRGRGPPGPQRHSGNDEPPIEPSAETLHQYDCLRQLQQYLLCQQHSSGGAPQYCWIEQPSENTTGGHREVTYEEMTLWAKHMVS
jgi:hypothetical protein